jgi:Fur family ferric uptake transcriptional regulator
MNANDLKNIGLKATTPRLKILEILEHSDNHHMSAEDIYRQCIIQNEEIGVATIYRVLTQFEQSGIIKKLTLEDRSVYELSKAEHHDHLICTQCGKIEEFNDATIEHCQDKIAEKFGYKLTDHSLYLYGICGDCQAPGAQKK